MFISKFVCVCFSLCFRCMCVIMRFSVSLFSVVSINAIDYLGRFVYCVSSGTVNSINSTQLNQQTVPQQSGTLTLSIATAKVK